MRNRGPSAIQRSFTRQRRKDSWFGVLTVLPAVLCILLLFGYPLATNLLLSFSDKNLIRPRSSFVGLSNYAKVLRDPATWNALAHGLAYSLSTVLAQVLTGFLCSLALFRMRSPGGRSLLRNLLLVPWATPFISGVFIWRWIYNDNNGLLNYLLRTLGIIAKPLAWLGSEGLAMPAAVAKAVWFGIPLMLVSILAGMQSIPETQFDTAQIEGAGVLDTVRYVILPNVRNIIVNLAVLRTIWTFNDFGGIYALTAGGPGTATQTLPILAYQTAWGGFLLGRSAALCVFMTLFLAGIIVGYYRLFRPEKDWSD